MKIYNFLLFTLFTSVHLAAQSGEIVSDGNTLINGKLISEGTLKISQNPIDSNDIVTKKYADSIILDFVIALGSESIQAFLNLGYDPVDILESSSIDSSAFIGMEYGGGVIIYQRSDGTGIIAAESDIQDAIWGYNSVDVAGALSYEIGDGLQNSQSILAGGMNANTGALYCDNLILSGFSDWYLPSVNELLQIAQVTQFLDSDQRLNSTETYLTSTGYVSNNMDPFTFCIVIRSQATFLGSRSTLYKVRPVRNF